MIGNRPVIQKSTLPDMTEAERKKRFGDICKIGCIACRLSYQVFTWPVIHHLCSLDSSRKGLGGKARDSETIGLCPRHHQGYGKGISYHDAPKTWSAIFGTQQELLSMTNRLLEKMQENGN